MIPFFWSPGWNSVQSINKYQQEIGGPLHGGDPGIRLLAPVQNQKSNYFTSMPALFKPADGQLLMVSLHHIFGSEELSQRAPGIAERSPKPYILLHSEDANKLKVSENQLLTFDIAGQPYKLAVKRFSGRTAMLANVNVSEPKPPEDPDSSLSYTMEGFRGLPPSTMIPFFWSPGWNSVQSINKYQQEIGGPLHGGDPGIRLLAAYSKSKVQLFHLDARSV